MNGEAEPSWMDLMAEWWSTHVSWAFWDICQNIPKCCLLVKAFICSAEAVLPAAGEAFWLQRWFEETTLGLQVLGETIVGHWRVDADGAVYSGQNVLGSLSFLPVLLRALMRQLLIGVTGSLEEAFLSLLGKKNNIWAVREKKNLTLFKKGKEKCKMRQPIIQGD